MNRTQRLCRVLRRFASVLFGLSIFGLLFVPILVFNTDLTLDLANHQLRLLDVDAFRFTATHLGWKLRAINGLAMATAFGASIFGLGVLVRLLTQFEEGTAFSLESVRLVRWLGWLQVALVPIGLALGWCFAAVTKALLGQVVGLWTHPIYASLDGLFWGGVTLLIAQILEEGFRLKAEQDLVI
jgi:hypothetical protein